MKTLIVILTDYSYPYLEEMLADVERAGVGIIPAIAVNAGCKDEEILISRDGNVTERLMPVGDEALRIDSYIVTDCRAGAQFASENNIGFVYYEPDDVPDTAGTLMSTEVTGAAKPQCIIKGFDETGADFLIKMYERFHHLPWTILETERLILREQTVDDVGRLYEIYADPSVTEYMEPLYPDRLQEEEYTRDYIKYQYEFCGYGLWAVVLKETSAVIGRAGITNREGYEEAELGYVIEAGMQNRGYATEACRAVIGYAGEVLLMKGLNCFIQPGNDVSVHLCEQLGFTYAEDVVLKGIGMMRYHIILGEKV